VLLPVAYQNQFKSTHIKAYWIPDLPPVFQGFLSPQEQSILSTITSISVRHQKIWSFVLTRIALGDALQQDPKTLQINRESKPFCQNAGVHFNVSHSENLWAIAWCFEQEVGFDVQKIDESIDYQVIMRQFFTESDRNQVKTIFDFFELWTKKEAILKLKGLSIASMREISTSDVQCVPFEITSAFKACLAL